MVTVKFVSGGTFELEAVRLPARRASGSVTGTPGYFSPVTASVASPMVFCACHIVHRFRAATLMEALEAPARAAMAAGSV